MQYSVEEFRPSNPALKIKGREIELSLITLHIDSRLKEKVDRLENIFDAIKKRPALLFETIWILVLDKAQFSFNSEVFQKAIYTEARTADLSQEMYKALNESINKSMPLIKNKTRHDELKKIRNLQNDEAKAPCYGIYYDTIAKRYSYTIDQFYNLTLRQLHILLQIIGDKSYEEIEIQAALQGKKLKPQMKALDIDEKADKEMDNEAADSLARLRKEYEANKKGK